MGWNAKGYVPRKGTTITRWQDVRDADGERLLANPKRRIDWFDAFLGPNPYDALSNYHLGTPFSVGGHAFASGEHAFQAWKAATRSGFDRVRRAATPDDAKQLGRRIRLRGDWEEVKIPVMRAVVTAKFAPGRAEADVLLGTSTAELVEGSLWHDDFWGVDLEEPGRPGRNELGKLLTAQRTALKSGRARVYTPPPLAWAA